MKIESSDILHKSDVGGVFVCVNRFSYIWLENGQSFWAYLVYVGKTSASGWRYRGGKWAYFGVDLKVDTQHQRFANKLWVEKISTQGLL